jgi:hypothetical protein
MFALRGCSRISVVPVMKAFLGLITKETMSFLRVTPPSVVWVDAIDFCTEMRDKSETAVCSK